MLRAQYQHADGCFFTLLEQECLKVVGARVVAERNLKHESLIESVNKELAKGYKASAKKLEYLADEMRKNNSIIDPQNLYETKYLPLIEQGLNPCGCTIETDELGFL